MPPISQSSVESFCPIEAKPLYGAGAITVTVHSALFFGGEGTTVQGAQRTAIHDPLHRTIEMVYQLARLLEADFHCPRAEVIEELRTVADALEKQDASSLPSASTDAPC